MQKEQDVVVVICPPLKDKHAEQPVEKLELGLARLRGIVGGLVVVEVVA
jgi:hypothetical protein